MRILLANQCFYPDVVSTAQHLTDLALELAGSGHEVTVLASRRGYDDCRAAFPKKEVWRGIKIIRIPTLAFGKQSRWRRALDFGSFMACCTLRLLLLPRFDVVVALTSPPLISFLASLFVQLKGGRFIFWVMDLNPDEAIAAGWLKESSLAGKLLASSLRHSLRQAESIIALDRFMKRRIVEKGIAPEKILVTPPWSHIPAAQYDSVGRSEFRAAHGLADKFVVMYSGNHSPCHPLDTLLEAALQLSGHPRIHFCFVGGGSEFDKMKRFAQSQGMGNITCLPYQPLQKLPASLSAADLHVVVMGDRFSGIVHPCKIYNVLSVGVPFLYIGPAESPIAEILSRAETAGLSFAARHGESAAVAAHILAAYRTSPVNHGEALMGLAEKYSAERLLPQMIHLMEQPLERWIPALGTRSTLNDSRYVFD